VPDPPASDVSGTRGRTHTRARAGVGFARERGARALEADSIASRNVIVEELHVGTVATFAGAGLNEIGRPTPRRVVMRIDL